MKTAMQELIEYLENNMEHGLAHHIKVKFLPKEKQQIIDAVNDSIVFSSAEEYFNQIYKQ